MIYNKSITATVYVCNAGKVLLHEHKKYKTWFPLGGHLNADEFPHQAAVREVKEESGLEVSLLTTEMAPPMDLGRVERIPSPFCIMHEGIGHEEEFFDFIFVAVAQSTSLTPEATESQIFKWFSLEELQAADLKPHVKNTAIAALNYLACTTR